MIKSMFFAGFPDAQCGFKALTRQTAQAIVPHVKNNNWFFDTELLLIAAKRGYRIRSITVKWDDDPSSTVNVASTAAKTSGGCCVSASGASRQWRRPASAYRGPGLSLNRPGASQARIEDVAQGVPQQVPGEDHYRDGQPRKHSQPW